jgi:hypothetical protein
MWAIFSSLHKQYYGLTYGHFRPLVRRIPMSKKNLVVLALVLALIPTSAFAATIQ